MSAQIHTLHLVKADAIPIARSRIKVNERAGVVRYVGSKEDLIQSRIATEEMFPELPKRVKARVGRDIQRTDQYKTKRLKGGAYEIVRWPEGQEERKAPSPWDPGRFKNDLAHRAWFYLKKTLVEEASGAHEIETHGQATHRLSQEDIDKLEILVDEMVSVIFQAKVENARGMQVVK